MPNRILITGGCGFLGSNLAAEGLARGQEIIVFDNLSRKGSDDNLKWLVSCGRLTFVHGDIRSRCDVMKVVKDYRPDCIFHVAGQVAMTTSIANPILDFEVNTIGTFNLLEAIREIVPRSPIVYSSTNKVYGDLSQFKYEENKTRWVCLDMPDGFDESVQLEFHSPYGCSKGAADQYMLDAHRIYGTKTIVFRHSSMYGGRQYATYDQGWVGWFCLKATEQFRAKKNGNPVSEFTISGDGKQVRDLLHSSDMTRLYFSCIEAKEDAFGKAYNVGGGLANSLSLLELLAKLEEMLGIDLKWSRLPSRKCDQLVFIANTVRAEDMLNWSPNISADHGLQLMLEWTEKLS